MRAPSLPPDRRVVRGRRRWWVVAGLLGVTLGATYAVVALFRPAPLPAGWPPPSDLAEYAAVLHVHSRYSHDGRGTIEDIAAAAARVGVRVVFLTDHNTFAPLAEGKEGWYGETLVLVGSEITTGSGYLLVLDPRHDLPARARGLALDDLVARYRAAGAIVLLAHVDHPRLGWKGEPPEIDGLEVFDVFDQVIAAPMGRQALGLLAYPANPVMAILSVLHWPRGVLERWDHLARERPTFGVIGLDAHGGIEVTEESGVRFPSHETAFRVGQLHFVTRDGLDRDTADRTRVYRALRAGHFYNAFDGLAPAGGFRFEMRRGEVRALMGDRVALAGGLAAEIRVPPVGEATVRLLKDGAPVHERTLRDGVPVDETGVAAPLRVPVVAPGVYRVEVDLRASLFPIARPRRIPWIFSNPIYVLP